ncbi:hypothetical protein [Shewanella sp. MM_2022_3]|uniref:hypothetical protein n=1 Tax=Shewanella sp. MM_2022_3 TaxID=2923280 RepID=UPI001F4C48B0|nr:hypothetical protein [Shewanella sp. MM_2022_3]MCH7422632.1 hypothetical protein [Shewanella sp. MM_2022_3]
MAIKALLEQHQKIGQVIEAAEKAMPFQAIALAKKAASQSHDLLGDIIEHVAELDKRVNVLEGRNHG